LTVVGEGARLPVGSAVIGVVKAERVTLGTAAPPDRTNALAGRVDTRTYLGAGLTLVCTVAGERIQANLPNAPEAAALQAGDRVVVQWRVGDCLVLPGR
jgi:ABC-type Fe3+/spermidine/putrescine transport system ATPase subunit